MSKAWDYAAKVLLRLRELSILFPSFEHDEDSAKHVYNQFNYGQHTFEEIKAFESTYLSTPAKNIKPKKVELTRNVRRTTERRDDEPDNYLKRPQWNTIHVRLPKNSGYIGRISVSMLYAAIVCLILRDTSIDASLPQDVNRETANTIYTMFSLLEDDLRGPRPWISRLPIFADVKKYGYHGAAALNACPTLKCNKCSNERKEIFVQMEERLEASGSIKFVCPKCGGEERIMRKLSTRHLRNMHTRAIKKAQDCLTYAPLYKDLNDFCKFIINNNKDDFLRRFQKYEVLARKDLLCARTHYFIGHYDKEKKAKRRWCSIDNQLAEVKIDDYRYSSQYLPSVNEAVDVHFYGVTDELPSLLKNSSDKARIICTRKNKC